MYIDFELKQFYKINFPLYKYNMYLTDVLKFKKMQFHRKKQNLYTFFILIYY